MEVEEVVVVVEDGDEDADRLDVELVDIEIDASAETDGIVKDAEDMTVTRLDVLLLLG
jgi:hypothetical protein